jgi:hypothetical protein
MTTGRKPVSCEREARARAGMPGRSPRTTAWYSGSTASTAYAYTPGRRRRARCPARSSSSANASRRAPSAPARWCARRSTSFPFTPPELSGGTAYRFNVYHIMQVDEPGAAVPGRARGSVIGPGRPGLLTARLPHRKGRPGTLERGSLEKNCPLRGTEGSNPSPSSRESVSRGTLSSWVKNPGFLRGCAGLRSRGRQRAAGPADIAPTRGNISVGPYSSTPFPAMRSRQVVGLKSQGWSPNEVGLSWSL